MMWETIVRRFWHFINDDSMVDLLISRAARVAFSGLVIILAIRLLKSMEAGVLMIAHRQLRTDKSLSPTQEQEKEKRLSTVVKVVGTAGRVIIALFGIFVVMRELGFDISPLVTGAGVAGVAVGFGSQSLVKDVISGIFLLLEDQIRIGDVIRVGLLSGTVERMELRVTVLRDTDGALHIIPNGEIKSVTNFTYQWSKPIVEVPLSYQAPLEKALEVISNACRKMEVSETYGPMLLEPITIQGLTEFSAADMKIRVLAKTSPAHRYTVQHQLRKMIKIELEREQIPFVGTDSKILLEKS